MDLAPSYASILNGMGNTMATLPGIIVPILTGYIVQNREADEWRIVFYITASVYTFGIFFYGLFGSGEAQPWSFRSAATAEMTALPGGDD